jgi:hypothetical protein
LCCAVRALPLLDLGGCTVGGLLADDAVVDGSVLLWRGFSCQGWSSFVGARIGGKLDLSGRGAGRRRRRGAGRGPDHARRRPAARRRGRHPAPRPAGTVQLTGARIAGRLSGRRLRLTNPAGPGLAAASLHVTDMVDLSRGIEVRGGGAGRRGPAGRRPGRLAVARPGPAGEPGRLGAVRALPESAARSTWTG